MLNKKEFSVLNILANSDTHLPQSTSAQNAGIAAASVKHILDELRSAGLFD